MRRTPRDVTQSGEVRELSREEIKALEARLTRASYEPYYEPVAPEPKWKKKWRRRGRLNVDRKAKPGDAMHGAWLGGAWEQNRRRH